MNIRSNLDRYLSIAGLPLSLIYGSTVDCVGITIGVDDALIFSNKDEEGFEWSELSGNSIVALQSDLDNTEEAILQEAITMTSNDLSVAKNEDQVASEQLEGFGRLTHLANNLEVGFNEALFILAEFASIQDVGTVTFNKDFKSSTLTSEQITDLIQLYSNGMISIDTALDKLEKGEIIEVEDLEAEKAKLNEPL